ncbi:MAG: HEPN domain-containing protein [Candidatus Woesearchaeota archaeon]
MDESRIKQAQTNFSNYLADGKIKKTVEFENIIYNTYIKNAKESLNSANQLMKNNTSTLWVVVTSYYSMFYIACAYIYKLGYKPGHQIVHKVVNETLITKARHSIKKHILENYSLEKQNALQIVDTYLTNYEKEKTKRSTFQYQTTEKIKENKAKTSLKRAKEFYELIRKTLLKNIN